MKKYTIHCKSTYDEIYEIRANSRKDAINYLLEGNDPDSDPREWQDSVFARVIPETIEFVGDGCPISRPGIYSAKHKITGQHDLLYLNPDDPNLNTPMAEYDTPAEIVFGTGYRGEISGLI